MRLRSFVLAVVSLVSCTQFASAEDWPEFRGPTGQGHSTATGLPVEWSSTQNVAWKQAINGTGWSSPVVSDGRIYLTSAVRSQTGPQLSLRALGLDAATGRVLWDSEVFASDAFIQIHSKNSQASPTPVVERGRLYVHFGHHGTACLNLDGQVLWRNPDLKYPPVHGNGGSPVIADNALIFNCDGGSDPFVVALNKTNGKVLWKVDRTTDAAKTFSFSTPLMITLNGQKQLISPGSNRVCAYDPKDGREIWRVRYDGYSVIPRPVFGHGLVFIGTGFDRPTVMAIRPDGQGDVTETHVSWTLSRGAPNTPSLLLVGRELYMVSDAGIASCVDALTGRMHWQERIGGNCSASPIYADGKIYLQNEPGLGVVLEAGKEFRKLASNALEERTLASYAVSDGALFIRTEKHLYRIQAETARSQASP
ncbi:MAG: PQQ-binding-like beta-propeller repeat protein [Verrucomicrobia bacterium]|nr:PQQ-binding-like beta-propeller repeat protein [Verrucomicrobiota bacterium]